MQECVPLSLHVLWAGSPRPASLWLEKGVLLQSGVRKILSYTCPQLGPIWRVLHSPGIEIFVGEPHGVQFVRHWDAL